MDNRSIAQVFAEIGDLLEIKGGNAFKIRAYRSATETIGAWPDAVASLDDAGLRKLPGIGKDLAAKIRELIDTGTCRYHQELLEEFPPTILDLLRLQGVGPKTVALLYSVLNIQTVEELAVAARDGRLRDQDPEAVRRLRRAASSITAALTGSSAPMSPSCCLSSSMIRIFLKFLVRYISAVI